jgi:uncharacterized damage-inducible protein DinB
MSKASTLAQFEKLEKQRLDIYLMISDLTHDKLNRHAPGKWSILQILEHLRVAEKQSLKVIKQNINQYHTKAPFKQVIKLEILKILFMIGKKFKAPKHVSDIPDPLDMTVQKSKWDETRVEFKNLLISQSEDAFDKAVFPHPVLGLLSLEMTLDFFYAHQKHHLKQIRKVLRES